MFDQEAYQDKNVYAVTKLPEFHAPSLQGMDINSIEVQESTSMQRILKLPKNDTSGFFEKFKFTLKKKSSGGIVNQCDKLIYKGSQHIVTNAVSIRRSEAHSNVSSIYEIDSSVKFSITCDKEGILFAKNPHYGWLYCSVEQRKFFPHSQISDAQDNVGKEIVLNRGGSRLKEKCIIHEVIVNFRPFATI